MVLMGIAFQLPNDTQEAMPAEEQEAMILRTARGFARVDQNRTLPDKEQEVIRQKFRSSLSQ